MANAAFFCLKESMLFYTVDDQYIAYLKTIDSKVPNNYSETKPFVGIVLNINGFTYLAPLTSPKPQHDHLKNSDVTCVKIHEPGKPDKKLGMIQLKNMIPVLPSVITLFDIQSRGPAYESLLNNQLSYIKSVQAEIETKSAKLYHRVTVNKIPVFVKLSCEFNALEQACTAYVDAAVAAFAAATPVVGVPAIAAAAAAATAHAAHAAHAVPAVPIISGTP